MSGKVYAVKIGRKKGIYNDWNSASQQVMGFPNAQYKSFKNIKEAEDYLNGDNTLKLNQNKTIVYTDGSCQNQMAGWAYIVVDNDGKIIKELNGYIDEYPSTNNRAELSAIYFALEDNQEDLIIYTDSQYSINSITNWSKGWAKNGWINSQGKQVENQDLIKEILKIQEGRDIEYRHIFGHNGNIYNERCDVLAKKGVDEMRKITRQ